ncbi:MAG: nicotinate-nicotinamide nucleotide adenylyltransferase [Candidatus Saccharimonadales bacterium]
MTKTDKIGIYAGTFDPVHSGHIAFALQAAQAAGLDKVYFLPERRPRAKQDAEHFGHRVAMLRQALKPHPKLELLESVEASFSVRRTLPQLKKRFDGKQLVFLMGSDVARRLADWPDAAKLVKDSEFVIGIRSRDSRPAIREAVEAWPARPRTVTMFDSFAPAVSSGIVREALRAGKVAAPGLLSSVERYSDRNWLYVSL